MTRVKGTTEAEAALVDVEARVERGTDVAEALAAARALAEVAPADSLDRAHALHVVGKALHRLRRSSEAMLSLGAAAGIYASWNAHSGQAAVHETLGRVLGAQGRLDLASHHYAMALLEWTLAEKFAAVVMTLNRVGRIQLQARRLLEATECFERADALATRIGDDYGRACARNNLGEVALADGCFERGESEQRASLAICEHGTRSGFEFVAFFAWKELARALAASQRVSEAWTALTEARAIQQRLRLDDCEAHLDHAEGEIRAVEKNEAEAAVLLDRAVRGFARGDVPDYEIAARIKLADMLERAGETADAEFCLRGGLRRARVDGYSRYLPLLTAPLTRLGASVSAEPRLLFGKTPAPVADRYIRRARLGAGAFGEVYRAYAIETGIEVAVKYLPLARAYDTRRAGRLLASIGSELAAAMRVSHPGVARVHDAGREPDGDAYVVQDLIEGGSLRERMRPTPDTPINDVLCVARQVAQALQALHDVAVVHRDLKPENIMMRPDDTPVLIDFGIARIEGYAKGVADDAVAGTLAYMAPEQAKSGRVDARADLYALGVVLYEWLTGTLPLRPRGADFREAAHDIARRAPIPIEDYRPGLPVDLVSLVHALLEKKARRRPTGAAHVADALARLEERTA